MASDSKHRRQFLKGLGGAASVGIIAGCTGGGGDGGDGGGDGGDGGGDGGDGGGDGGDGGGDGGDGGGGTNYPQRDLTSIVHYGEGGYNFYARLVAKYINQKGYLPNDAQVKVQNISGGGGIVGMNQLYNAEPDGYTYGIVNGDSMARSQLAEDAASYDLAKMTAFPKVAGSLPCLAVRQDSDIQTAEELIAAIQNEEVKIAEFSWGSTTGTAIIALGRVGGLIDNTIAKLGRNVIIYGGRGEAITAMKRGEVTVDGGSYSSVLPFVESDDLRMLLVFTGDEEPPEQTPDAQTLADLDVESAQDIIGFIGATWHRIFLGPPDIPEERANILREAITAALQDEDLLAEADGNDRPVTYASSSEVADGVESMIRTWNENQEVLELLEEHRPS